MPRAGRRDGAREALGLFIHDSARRGLRCVRVVHGKGHGSPGREPVLKGRVRFYGPGDKLIGEFGPHEGTVTPRYSRYWFENAGDGDAELLQVSALWKSGMSASSGRTDLEPQKFQIGNTPHFEARKK